MIKDDDASTWRTGEQVEATLVTERGPGNLIRVGHGDGDVFLRASAFAEVRPVGDDPERVKTLKTLRTQLVEERLAAANARSDTAMAQREIDELHAEIGRLHTDGAAVMRAHRLAVAALRHIHELDSRGPLPPLPFLDLLLGTEERPGSLAEPCGEVLRVEEPQPGCGDGCCWTEVAAHPCMLRRGHFLVKGKELHQTLAGREFEDDEMVRDGGGPDDE